MQYDVIVIGGGLGGLTAGASLAKQGKRVLLIEQHNIPGGCATTFKRKGFTMEVGLHEIDGLSGEDMKNEIFEELSVSDHVNFVRLPEFYRFKHNEIDIVVPDDHEKAREALKLNYPDEEKGIDRFFDVILKISRQLKSIPRGG